MRDTWNVYFMKLAHHVATRATCDRKHVGAVIVKNKMIVSTGYNGSIRNMEHCDTIGHMMEDNHCVRTIHAEVNAIAQAARNGVAIDGASMYVNVLPCWNCFKQIVNAGIKEIYFGEMYGAIKPEMVQACENNTIKLEQIIIGQSGGAIWKGTHWGP